MSYKKYFIVWLVFMVGIIFFTVAQLSYNFNQRIKPSKPETFFKVDHQDGELSVILLGEESKVSTKNILVQGREYLYWAKTELEDKEWRDLIPPKLASWGE